MNRPLGIFFLLTSRRGAETAEKIASTFTLAVSARGFLVFGCGNATLDNLWFCPVNAWEPGNYDLLAEDLSE